MAFGAARHCSKDVIGVHGAQNQGRSVPLGGAEAAADYAFRARSLQAGHANRRQILGATFELHLENKIKHVHNVLKSMISKRC